MKWLAFTLLAAFGLIGGCLWYALSHDPELSHKAGWSILQGIEFDERGHPFASSELKWTRDGRFAVISIQGVGKPKGGPTDPPQVLPRKAWILLNEHATDNTVLILPKYGSYRVSCASVGQLSNSVPDVDRYVLKFLSTICN